MRRPSSRVPWPRRSGTDSLIVGPFRDAPPDQRAFKRPLIDLCYERGFVDLTVDDLCRRAQVDRAVFDARYADLEDCFAEAYGELADEFLDRVTAAYEAEGAWREQLRAASYATMQHLEEDPARAHFTVVEALQAGEKAQLVRDRVFATLFSLIDRGRDEPDAPASLTATTAESLNGAIFRHMRLAIENDQSHRFADVLPELMHAVVLQYLGPEAAAEELEIVPPTPATSRDGGRS